MMTHEKSVEVLQAVMDRGETGWLRPIGSLGWAVWWDQPGLLVTTPEDFAAWSSLLDSGLEPVGEVLHG